LKTPCSTTVPPLLEPEKVSTLAQPPPHTATAPASVPPCSLIDIT
jgi:hypothetical protein